MFIKPGKTLSLLLAAAVMISMFAAVFTSSAAGGLATGDYVSFGTYNGAPILWRVIKTDGDGALLFSEKILALKAFDAAERIEDLPAEYPNVGNSFWGSSNLRQWLNSAEEDIEYLANAPVRAYVENGYNDYAGEPGFLYEFTQEQRSMIKTSAQKYVLDMLCFSAAREGGARLYTYSDSFETLLQNYDNAYYMTNSEKVFLLSTKQLYEDVYLKGFPLAKYPTAAAVTLSEYKSGMLSAEKPWKYWLRTPRTEDNSSVRVNYFGNHVLDDAAWNGTVGVTPALYIDINAPVASGSGSAFSPYVIAGGNSSFSDLAGYEAYAGDAIYLLASKGIVNGYGDGTFKPGESVSRADFVLMLMRALGQTGSVTSNFSDVPADAYYYNAVGQAKLRLYAGGDENGNFNPNAAISIQDMYLIAARALSTKNGEAIIFREGELDNYLDAGSVSSYAVNAMSWLSAKRIIEPIDGRMYATSPATRADCARLIFNLLGNIAG